MTKLRAAVVQAAPVMFDPQRTIAKLGDLAADAARAGAQLAVFPEAFVSAYPRGLDFGATVGNRSAEGREEYRRYVESSIEVPSAATEKMGAIAKRHKLYLVIGAIEREFGTLYCTVAFFAPDGTYLGKHRKLMPTGSERLVWGMGDGSTMPVFSTPFGKIGAVICWENYMPLMRTAMYAKGIEIYCAPTADTRDSWAASMQHIALEGRCFVLSSCQFARRRDFPADYGAFADKKPDDIVTRGGSLIVSPLGKILAGPNYTEECILTADIDLDDILRGKYDFDPVGHYARPDIFRLHVDETPRRPVVTTAAAAVADGKETEIDP